MEMFQPHILREHNFTNGDDNDNDNEDDDDGNDDDDEVATLAYSV